MKKTKFFTILLGIMMVVCLLVSMQMIVAGAAEDTGCTHANKTAYQAASPTCTAQGWETYIVCDDCDAILDGEGNVLAAIPYIDGGHAYSDTLSYDETGHWYACAGCDEKHEYAEHSGGVATCNSPAVCKVCGQQYGEDVDGHLGGTHIKNKKLTWCFGGGYTGDVYCNTCSEMIEAGHATTKYDFEYWPGRIWVVAIPLFPIVVLGWIIMEIV